MTAGNNTEKEEEEEEKEKKLTRKEAGPELEAIEWRQRSQPNE